LGKTGLKIHSNYLKAGRMEIKLVMLFNIFYDKYPLEVFLQAYMQSPVYITFTLYQNYLNKLCGQLSKETKCVRAGDRRAYGISTAGPIIWLGNTTPRMKGPLHGNFEVCLDIVFVNL